MGEWAKLLIVPDVNINNVMTDICGRADRVSVRMTFLKFLKMLRGVTFGAQVECIWSMYNTRQTKE